MTSQLQVLNKILNTKDYSIITLHNLTEDYFFNYKAEFNYIKNHFKQFQAVPDKLTFASVFPDFDFIDVNEPDSYLVEQLIQDYNQSYLATVFNKIKPMLEKGDVDKTVSDISKAQKLLGYNPKTKFVDGIAKFVSWWQKQQK